MRATLWLLHHAGRIILLCLALLLAASGGLAWRLAQGPLNLPFLAARLTDAANADTARRGDPPIRVAIGGAALTWEGFRLGVDRPVDIRLTDITIVDPLHGQRVAIPRAEVSLGVRALLLGRIEPRAVEIDGARLVIQRTEAGEIRLNLGEPTQSDDSQPGIDAILPLIANLSRPDDLAFIADPPRFRQLRRLLIRNVSITLVDRKLDTIWHASSAAIDLRRRPQGGAEGNAELALDLGADTPTLKLTGTLEPAGAGPNAGVLRLHADINGIAPMALARHSPQLTPLAAIDTVLAGVAEVSFAADLTLLQARLELHAGAGFATVGPTRIRLDSAHLIAEGNDRRANLTGLELRLIGHDGGPVSTLAATGTLQRVDARLKTTLALKIDHVDFADLGTLWPAPVAYHARDWVVANITAGIARDARADIGIDLNPDGSGVVLSSATGSLTGENLTVHWLRPVPPIEHGMARLTILDPDNLSIAITAGRQVLASGRQSGGLRAQSGTMHINGLSQKDQVGEIEAKIAGPIADAISLLQEKRLHLLDRFPVELKDPGGQLSGTLNVTVPMEDKLTMDQVPIRTALRLQDLHLTGIAAGRDLDHGNLSLNATTEGLKLAGQAEIATIPAALDGDFDFRAGPPSQVQQRITVSARPRVEQLAALGLATGDALSGTLGLRAVVSQRRDTTADIAVNTDLADAGLVIAPLEWRKPAGVRATASARVRLRRDRVTSIDDILVDGDGIALRAKAVFNDGRASSLAIDRIELGRTRARGSVRLTGADGAIEAELSGTALDLAPILARKPDPTRPVAATANGPAWKLDARFDRVYMAGATTLLGVTARARSDGKLLRELNMEATTGPNAPVRINLTTATGGRNFTASAANAGDLLRALDVMDTMRDGKLSLTGSFADSEPNQPLVGTAEIESFRILDAPALGRLLQAMTLYGVVEVMQGSGLGFSRLVAPFRYGGDVLELTDARAFSASLGLTAKGRIDLAARRLDLQGTIVPAYFFNSLLGNIPLIGRLFSPEEGGGLFAATYGLRGPIDDPEVWVNPLSALTPGFLRGLFGIF